METFTVPGFLAAAVNAGIKPNKPFDLGLIHAPGGAQAAGIFTRNRVAAPSVVLNRARLRAGQAAAVLVNSGNANTMVGERGRRDTLECTGAVAQALRLPAARVLMSSTGVIGEPLPAEKILAALPGLVAALRPDGFADFARAIMTTDTRRKLTVRRVKLHGRRVTLLGTAKGAGMIQPNMGTMLAYVMTDLAAPAAVLRALLREAAEDTFNAVSVDGDTSTSDTLLLLASGAAGLPPLGASGAARQAVAAALTDLCAELADLIAADGEGATKLFRVEVRSARSRAEADRVARRIANSLLVKTAFHAADPNWGRIAAAAGSAGVAINPRRLEITFVSADGRTRAPVVRQGALDPAYRETNAAKLLQQKQFRVIVALHQGRAARTVSTCDLSAEYVRINAEYRS